MTQHKTPQQRRAFTMIEILVVLSIMALLAAIIYPVFSRTQENGRQKNCSSNLHQIYQAVQLYYADERRYPGSLAFLLPENAELADNTPVPAIPDAPPNMFGTGYYKGGTIGLRCPSDRFKTNKPRSSYGDISGDWELPGTGDKSGMDGTNHVDTTDVGRYVWNYLGYDQNGYAYFPHEVVSKFGGSTCSTTSPCKELINPESPYSSRNAVNYSMSNRFAPPATIITHCVNHRLFNSNLTYPGELTTAGDRAQGARDIILRLDGTAKTYDVSTFAAPINRWQTPVS